MLNEYSKKLVGFLLIQMSHYCKIFKFPNFLALSPLVLGYGGWAYRGGGDQFLRIAIKNVLDEIKFPAFIQVERSDEKLKILVQF